MALARCGDCGCPTGRGNNAYSRQPYSPISFPESGVICGREGCRSSGYVWLTRDEETKYKSGEKVFPLTGGHAGTKFHLQ